MIIPVVSLQHLTPSSEVGDLELAVQILSELTVEVKEWQAEKLQTVIRSLSRPQQYNIEVNIDKADEALYLLDLGVKRVVLKCNKVQDCEDLLRYAQSYPRERLGCVVKLEMFENNEVILGEILKTISFCSISSPKLDSSIFSSIQPYMKDLSSVSWSLKISSVISVEEVTMVTKNQMNLLVPIQLLSLEGGDKMDLAEALRACLTSDRFDELIPTCVVNSLGVNLGLAYSSTASIREALTKRQGVYFSRKHGIWHKGLTSGSTQDLVRIAVDCDSDTLLFTVIQHGSGFCHLNTSTCFGVSTGLSELDATVQSRRVSAPVGSYTHRLFNDSELLRSKIMEEAEELCFAETPEDVAWEAADLLYFALVKCASAGVSLADVQANIERKALKITRRAGDAKPQFNPPQPKKTPSSNCSSNEKQGLEESTKDSAELYLLQTHVLSEISENEKTSLLNRPILSYKEITARVEPILQAVRQQGDSAILKFTSQFDKVELDSVTITAPFSEDLMTLSPETRQAIDVAYDNIYAFHSAQAEEPLEVETCPGVVCTRFSRPIQRVGLYVPGGSAVLPSTALMLGIPAKVAGCSTIVIATPPGSDGRIAPEVVYVAHRIGATHIIRAGGAQAIGGLAYGTATVPKVDKICGPGNQYVTSAKMLVQNDTTAMVAIDMPAGPSEVLVIADASARPAFVASDLLSQAEHGPDSQAVLITVGLQPDQISNIIEAVRTQAASLPRKHIIAKALAHSFHLQVDTMEEALSFSNHYAPEHLILQVDEANKYLEKVQNAGSVFLGHYSPESCGDYASGTNHTLPTYGYARMYAGVSYSTFRKAITSQHLTADGLKKLGPSVEILARVEGLEAHAQAVSLRLAELDS